MTPPHKFAFSVRLALTCLASWVMIDFVLSIFLSQDLQFAAQLYLVWGFVVMTQKNIIYPIKAGEVSLAGWFKSYWWACWWPWYVVRRQR